MIMSVCWPRPSLQPRNWHTCYLSIPRAYRHAPLRSKHKLDLKAVTAFSSLVATLAIYHQAAFMLKWYSTAGKFTAVCSDAIQVHETLAHPFLSLCILRCASLSRAPHRRVGCRSADMAAPTAPALRRGCRGAQRRPSQCNNCGIH